MHYVVTLVERDYVKGALVLFNSLLRNGFDGRFVIGFRCLNNMPFNVIRQLQDKKLCTDWVEIDTETHFTNYKPKFMLDILNSFPECSKITYIDPDIVINSPFSWIASWCDIGPAVCADVNWMMPAQHPTRMRWQELTRLKINHQLDYYFNAGFISLKRNDSNFLALWQDLLLRWGDYNIPLNAKGDIGKCRKDGRWFPFMAPDQDTLNIALMGWPGSVITLGPDVMGFTAFGEIPHAVGSNKPWQRNFLLEAIKGNPPRYVDKVFWSYADEPLALLSSLRYKLKTLTIQLSALLSRFYSR